ncbi:hypothetical protein MASR1M12_03780 [Erysipelotrichia bacterium]
MGNEMVKNVSFSRDAIVFDLLDGRTISAPGAIKTRAAWHFSTDSSGCEIIQGSSSAKGL